MSDARPPSAVSPAASFVRMVDVPAKDYRTAIAVKHDHRMHQVEVSFVLQQHDEAQAIYRAACPRCQDGQIVVSVKLAKDGSFGEAPACPSLCMDCEDRLDALLDPCSVAGSQEKPSDRATLQQHLKTMSTRAWD